MASTIHISSVDEKAFLVYRSPAMALFNKPPNMLSALIGYGLSDAPRTEVNHLSSLYGMQPPAPRTNALLAGYGGPPASVPRTTDTTLESVGALYPRLRQYLPETTVRRGRSNDGRQLEFYAPWQRDNPAPGRITVEVYNPRLQGRDLHESIGLDLLHHIGGRTPSGAPVDPQYYALKQDMARAIRSANRRMDVDAWQQDRNAGLASDSYDEWLENNRVDAYIRGYVSPRMNPEWRQPGTFTPEMERAGNRIREYLRSER